jgi:hypothetical protein
VPDRLSPRLLQGFAAFAVTMALCGAAVAAPPHAKKEHPRKPPLQQSVPRLSQYIHCAVELSEGPCGLDPAMQRLNGGTPDSARPAPPFDQPEFTPER